MRSIKLIIIACLVIVSGSSLKTADDIYSKKHIRQTMERVCNWQLANPLKVNLSEDWARAVFYVGVMRAYNATHNKTYLNAAMHYADSVKWRAGKRFRHADDLARGQVFIDLYGVKKDPARLAGIKSRIASPKAGRADWWWCDALFMEPPVLVRLAAQTGDQKYLTYLNEMWWDNTDFLFDKTESLYYRDKSYFNKTTPSGKKVFWSRGNGWVMGGLVQVIERLPKTDAAYPKYVELYKTMAAKIAQLQQPDGLWRASLLDANQVPVKETSGTGFYIFALAWGINQGLLNRDTYLPVVERGWQALNNAITPDGKLTWVQQIGASPDSVKESDNQEYGSGAFLMAGTEIMKLKR